METQSNTFIPKYGLITYVMPFAYFGISAFLIAFWIVVRYLLYGGDYWTGIYGGIVFAAAAIYDATRIVKAVEFDENEMIVRYHVWMEKVIDYREIKGIDVRWRYINAKGAKVYFGAMINQVELQTKVADILRSRKILDINLVEEGMKKQAHLRRDFATL